VHFVVLLWNFSDCSACKDERNRRQSQHGLFIEFGPCCSYCYVVAAAVAVTATTIVIVIVIIVVIICIVVIVNI